MSWIEFLWCFLVLVVLSNVLINSRGRPGCDCLVVRITLLMLWVQTLFIAKCTWYNIMWESSSVTCDRLVVFSGYSSFLKTGCHNITEILLKVALNTRNLNLRKIKQKNEFLWCFFGLSCLSQSISIIVL